MLYSGRDGSKLEQIKQQFPHIHTVQSDVSDPKEISQLYNNITKEFPALNIIINNAGLMRNMDLQDTSMDLENITQEIDTNLSGTIRMAVVHGIFYLAHHIARFAVRRIKLRRAVWVGKFIQTAIRLFKILKLSGIAAIVERQ